MRGAVGHIARFEAGAGFVHVVGGIGAVSLVGQQEVVGVAHALELGIDHAGHGAAAGTLGLGDVHRYERLSVGRVVLPAAGDDGVAALHEEAVAEVNIGVFRGVVLDGEASGAVEVGERDAVAAVHDVEHEATAAPGAVGGQQDGDVG